MPNPHEPALASGVAQDAESRLGRESPGARSGLVAGLTRYDLSFLALVATALMVLCVVSGPGTPLFLFAIGAGAGLAIVWVRFRRSRHPNLKDDRPDE